MRRILPLLSLGACIGGEPGRVEPVTVFAAASLARPLGAIADSFHARSGTPVQSELGGSYEHARRVTDLGIVPDAIVLADDTVMASLMPAHVGWYVRFATSPLVVAYTDRSRHADSVTAGNWWRVLAMAGVTVGRADSALAPAGRHALALLRRAEGYYSQPGLTVRLMRNAGERLVRPNASELAALLEAGQVDYILEYESVSRQFGFRYVTLPADLAPVVLYTASVPKRAGNAAGGVRYVATLLSDAGRRILREHYVNALRVPVAIGDSLPAEIAAAARTTAATGAGRPGD